MSTIPVEASFAGLNEGLKCMEGPTDNPRAGFVEEMSWQGAIQYIDE